MVATVAALVLSGKLASAQVNTESVRDAGDREGLSGRVEASVTGSTGNTVGMLASGSGRIQLRAGRHLTFLYATGDYTRLNHETLIARSMSHARYNYELVARMWAEAFTQVENDRFRRITDRELLGLGPRVQWIDAPAFQLFTGSAYMAEWEVIRSSGDSPGIGRTLSHRWSNYLTFAIDLDERLSAGSTTYAQPRFDAFNDVRILNETFFEASVTDRVSVKVSTRVQHDSEPPEGVESTDAQIRNAFVLEF